MCRVRISRTLTPEQVAAFVADSSPQAFERVVDDLLAWMHRHAADFTNTFRDLSSEAPPTGDLYHHPDFLAWHARWQNRLGKNGARVIRTVRARIEMEGPLLARDFDDKGQGAWWGWGPSKTALEYLWRTGELAIARREGFEKVYDLASRVIPEDILARRPGLAESQDWFCREALFRLGFASPQEIAAFWNHVPLERVKWWIQRQLQRGHLVHVEIEATDGSLHPAIAPAGIEPLLRAGTVPPPPADARLLSPFDPLIRDRRRTRSA